MNNNVCSTNMCHKKPRYTAGSNRGDVIAYLCPEHLKVWYEDAKRVGLKYAYRTIRPLKATPPVAVSVQSNTAQAMQEIQNALDAVAKGFSVMGDQVSITQRQADQFRDLMKQAEATRRSQR